MTYRNRLAKLKPEQRHKLSQLLARQGFPEFSTSTNTLPENSSRLQLVAYVVSDKNESCIEQLQGHAERHLPDYMRPAMYVHIDSMPYLDNGKRDYSSLPEPDFKRVEENHPDAAHSKQVDIPTQPTETFHALANILSNLIGMDDIRPTDNFFEIGGDSITAIQLVSRARESGIHLTVSGITSAANIGVMAATVKDDIEPKTEISAYGSLPLTPIQNWFLSHQHPAPEHWNLGGIMHFNNNTNALQFAQAIKLTCQSHPALAARFIKAPAGWSSEIAESEIPDDRIQIIPQQAASNDTDYLKNLQDGFSLDAGWLLGFIISVPSDKNPSANNTNTLRLYWAVHHLVCDGISVHQLLDDIKSRYQQLIEGKESSQNTAQPSSYREWALELQKQCELKSRPSNPVNDHPGLSSPDTQLNLPAENSCLTFSKLVTGPIVSELASANDAYGTTTHELVLTALSFAWSTVMQLAETTIDIETHGRDVLDSEFDTSGVIGWYTSYFPFKIELSEQSDELSDDPSDELSDELSDKPSAEFSPIGSRIKTVKESYRQQQKQGQDYLLMRYGTGIAIPEIATLERDKPNFLFNFINYTTTSGDGGDTSFWQPVDVSTDLFRSPHNHRSHVLELNTIATKHQIAFNFRFVQQYIDQTTVEKIGQILVKQLQEIVEHCNDAGSTGYTPSDFPELNMQQNELDDFLRDIDLS